MSISVILTTHTLHTFCPADPIFDPPACTSCPNDPIDLLWSRLLVASPSLPLKLGWWCGEKWSLQWCRQTSLMLWLLLQGSVPLLLQGSVPLLLLGLVLLILLGCWLYCCYQPVAVVATSGTRQYGTASHCIKSVRQWPSALTLMVPLALWANQIFLIITTSLALGLEGLCLLRESQDLLSLDRICYHSAIHPQSLLLQAPLILALAALSLATRLTCGPSLMV